MLPEEVKRLKVAELRVRLQDMGLDSRGLKAQLVARLISAIEAEMEPVQTGEETVLEEKTLQGKLHDCKTVTNADVCSVGARDEELEKHNSQMLKYRDSVRSFVDQSTQTETDFPPQCSCSCRREPDLKTRSPEKHLQEPCQTNAPMPSTESENDSSSRFGASPPEHEESVVSSCSSFSQPISDLEEIRPDCGSHHIDNKQTSCILSNMPDEGKDEQDEGRSIQRPLEQRGRDYYEFKEEIQYNRAKTPEPCPVSEDDNVDDKEDMIRLDHYNGDLHFEVGADGSSGQPLLWEKFPLLWSGCRLSHGVTQGNVGFEVKFVKQLSSSTVDLSFDPEPHVLRVGWSVDGSSLQLGEEMLSFGFDSRGKAMTEGKKEEFGERFSEGDIIGCYVFINERGETELSFYKNGHLQGVAFRISSSTLAGRALFPHVLCKNCSVHLNLDRQGKTWYPGPDGYWPLPALPPAQWIKAPLAPLHRKDCEVLMMVGLPGSGKSHWVQSLVAQNPAKRYSVLSTHTILCCMKLPDVEQKELQLQQATQCLTYLIRTAANQHRNFILDQANIYPSARRHKMLCFRGYRRRAVVVVPPEEEWRRRLKQRQQQEGEALPETSLLKSKASFTLPDQGDLLEEVQFVELGREEAQQLLTSYKEEARCLLPTPPKRKKHPNKKARFPLRPRAPAYGRSHNLHNRYPHAQQAQWGWQREAERSCFAFTQSYGCNSDPQIYREYYQTCTTQWSPPDQNQTSYSNHEHYFGNQGFW